jgi:alkylation response protein AidB-like acyl-CoA dehydrogenase
MPPRRERQSHDPEDKGNQRGRGRQAQLPDMERQIRDLRARLEDMEAVQRRTASDGDLSDSKGEVEAKPQGEVAAKDAANEWLIKAIARMSSKTKVDIPTYEGSLDVEELLDWI